MTYDYRIFCIIIVVISRLTVHKLRTLFVRHESKKIYYNTFHKIYNIINFFSKILKERSKSQISAA